MKRIVRLTESDLARIVRRVISEDAATATSTNPWSLLKNPTLANIAKTIYDAKGYFNDDEKIVIAAISKIKDKNMWGQVNKELQKLTGGQGIIQYMNTFMQHRDYIDIEWNGKSVYEQLEAIFGSWDASKYPFKDLNFEDSFLEKLGRERSTI